MADPNDLMSMQEPGLPSFLDMARASTPVMQPTSPSPFAGIMYGQDKMRHDELLDKASYMAELRKQLDEQRTAEFQAAAPGRRDRITLGNQMAGADLGDASTLIDARHATNQSAVEEAKAKGADAQAKILKGYGVDGWDDANEATKRLIYNKAQDSHAAFANGMSFEDFDNYMTHIGEARKNEPTIYGRVEVANKRLQGAQAMADARIKVEEMRDLSAEKLKRIGIAANLQDPNYTKLKGSLLYKASQNMLTPKEAETLTDMRAWENANARLRVEAQPGQFNIPGIPPRIPPVVNTPPPFQPGTGAQPQPAAPAGPPPAQQLDPRAMIHLNAAGPGVPVPFKNGQVWMIDPQTHQPRRLDAGK